MDSKKTAGAGAETAAEAEAQAIATRVPPTGLRAVIEELRTVDEDAQVIWTTKGAKNTSTVELAGVLFDVSGDGRRATLIVQVLASGKSRIYMEHSMVSIIEGAKL